MNTTVKLLFFGLFKDIMGKKEFSVVIEQSVDFKSFLKIIQSNFPQFTKILLFMEDKDQKQPVFVMVNGESIKQQLDLHVKNGDEVAFLPPVGGG